MSGYSKRKKKKNGIPDRWLDYKAVGRRIDGTRFIAFKVPLNQSLNRHLPSSEVFGLWDLLDCLNQNQQELGLIIDLTFTTRYYRLQDVPDSLLFLKIFTAGHEVPSDDTILSFKRAVRWFLRENPENDKLIGVHCTHGLNRTGYLICRYLIDVDGMDPQQAVELFSSCRGHAVERQNYLEDLKSGPKRSNEGMDQSEQEPMRGLAAHPPPPPDCDIREDRPPRLNESWTHSRSNHRGLLPSPPLLPPFLPGPWRTPHPEGPWRPLHSEERRSRYLPPEPERRSRYYPPEPERRSRYYPPEPERRSRYCPPEPERRSRYCPPEPERRSSYCPPEGSRSRYHGADGRRPPSFLQEVRTRTGPPPLPRYSVCWSNESSGADQRDYSRSMRNTET